jgi:hypothetical protein
VAVETTSTSYDESHARAVAGMFDPDYYLANNPDVRAQGLDPLVHFMTTGWCEGRNPSRSFDVGYYRRANPDVAATGLNPLLHYCLSGAAEGRLPQRPLDALRSELEHARAQSTKVRDWTGCADRSAPLSCHALTQQLAAAVAERKALVVAVSHDDYARNLGGVQNAIRHERLAVEQMGWAYLHLSPAAPLPTLPAPGRVEDFRFHLRLDGEALGVAVAADVVATLADLRSDEKPFFLIVHHLMGHAPEVVLKLAGATIEPIVVWVHDYFTLCANYNLLRNDVRFCGAPPSPAAGACSVCVYGADRASYKPRIQAFFRATRPLVLAPSEVAMGLWRSRGGLAYRETHVQPLARLALAPDLIAPAISDRPLRVAHLGMRFAQKGWLVFEELALKLIQDPGYAFYQLGGPHGAALPRGIRHVHVEVGPGQEDAMVDAITEHRIDVVVSWSPWPETFCFAVHEAIAGGAFVLTHRGAGNVVHATRAHAPEQVLVLDGETALFELFTTGKAREIVSAAPRRRGALIAEAGSVAWLRRLHAQRSRVRAADMVLADV